MYIVYLYMTQKIKIQTIKDTVKEYIPSVVEVIKQSGTNLWFIRFASSEDMTDNVYETLDMLSFVKSSLPKEHDRKYKNIMATLNLQEVNTYYERQLYNYRGNQ